MENEILPTYRENHFDDFEAQTELLTGHDQKWVKLSPGPFHGSFASAFPGGGISVHRKHTNCSLLQQVGCQRDMMSLGVALSTPSTFTANGLPFNLDSVLISKPGADLSLRTPREGSTVLILCIERAALERAGAAQDIPSVLDMDKGHVTLVQMPTIAALVRTGAMHLLQATQSVTQPVAALPGEADRLVAAIAWAFAWHESIGTISKREKWSNSFSTFVAARDALATLPAFDLTALAAATGRSPRAIQLAFKAHAQITPLQYFQTQQLARVRRALLTTPAKNGPSIGDLSAMAGFWDHSRFTRLYRTLFGELPSETKAKAGLTARAHQRDGQFLLNPDQGWPTR